MSKRFIKPKALKEGDTIGIVSPSSSFDVDNFKEGVKKLKSLGFKVKYERKIFSKYWSCRGHDQKRAEQINRMFADDKVKAILCAKAGYGSVDIMPYLDNEVISNNPKIFIGYSDITMLLLYLQRIANMVVFHGPVVSDEIYEGMNPSTLDYLLKVITKPEALGDLRLPQFYSVKPGKTNGVVVGGNMSLIVEALGTPYEIDTDNKILFLEDIGEDSGAMHQYFLKLKKAKKLTKVKGLIFGFMVNCFDDPNKCNSIKSILADVFSGFNKPIIFGFPSGHCRERGELRITLPLGVPVNLDSDQTIIKFKEAGVS